MNSIFKPKPTLPINILYRYRYEPFYIAAVKSSLDLKSLKDTTSNTLYQLCYLYFILASLDNNQSTFQIKDFKDFCMISLSILVPDITPNPTGPNKYLILNINLEDEDVSNPNKINSTYDEVLKKNLKPNTLTQQLFKNQKSYIKNKLVEFSQNVQNITVDFKTSNNNSYLSIRERAKVSSFVNIEKEYNYKKGFIASSSDVLAKQWTALSETRFRNCFLEWADLKRIVTDVQLFDNDKEWTTCVDMKNENVKEKTFKFGYKDKDTDSDKDNKVSCMVLPLLLEQKPEQECILYDCDSAERAMRQLATLMLKKDKGLVRFNGITCNVEAMIDLSERLPITGPRFIPLSIDMYPIDDTGKKLIDNTNGMVDSEKVMELWKRRRRTTVVILLLLSFSIGVSNHGSCNVMLLFKEWATMSQLYLNPMMQLHILTAENQMTELGRDRISELLMRVYMKLYMMREDPKIARPTTTGYTAYLDNIYQAAYRTNTFPMYDPLEICNPKGKVNVSIDELVKNFTLAYPSSLSEVSSDINIFINKVSPPTPP